jgi:hypothetical protein
LSRQDTVVWSGEGACVCMTVCVWPQPMQHTECSAPPHTHYNLMNTRVLLLLFTGHILQCSISQNRAFI